MKQTLILFYLLQLFTPCFAQNKLHTGVTIGYNNSTFIGNDKPGKGLKPIPGFYLGGIINYRINERFTLLSNVALGSRGTEINTISDLYEYVLFLYLDVPVMLKLNFFTDKKISPYALLGSAFDYNIIATSVSGGALYDIKKFDLGIVSGLGLDIGKVSLGVRYNYGVTKFDNSNLKLGLRNSTVSFLVGIMFNK
jgi:hypothetical protein